MKTSTMIMLISLPVFSALARDLKSPSFVVGKQTFKNPTLKYSGEGDTVNVFHSSGIATLKISDLPEDIKKSFFNHYKLDGGGTKKVGVVASQESIDRAFKNQCLKDGWVTYIEQNYENNFYVRLPAHKYTSKENAKSIAEFMARIYVNQNKLKGGKHTSATVHVFKGDEIYSRGSHRD